MAPKRKRLSAVDAGGAAADSSRAKVILPPSASGASIAAAPTSAIPPAQKMARTASRGRTKVDTNPDHNGEILDGKAALRASPDADEPGEALDLGKALRGKTKRPANGVKDQVNGVPGKVKHEEEDSPLSDLDMVEPVTPAGSTKPPRKTPTKSSISAKKGADETKAFVAEQKLKKAAEVKIKKEQDGGEDEWDKRQDPDGDDEGPTEDADVLKLEASRPPPVNSDYLPLPWKGRLGYACLNTYLRLSNPPIFSSRTCRIASILEHRHPLKDPSQPEHATKNRPDKTQPASIERGQRYVEDLALANVRDIPKMLRWNDKYGIKFLRLSSEMFPFASHAEYGYTLAPFASEALAEVGKVIAQLGHRVSTHPGQFTQLGSPRAEVISNAFRDLEYHDEMLALLKLPPQDNRDAVMILHMGGTFGDKAATLDRFRENYAKLSDSIKQRLVLENDDVSWSVHDLLPVCEELNIPLCLDFHHHNIIFDSTKLREGTKDIMDLFPRIKATWDRKQIRQKMHYSEPTPQAITGRQRRKHNPRPATLPPCPTDMDLMIEAKDKEQAIFELMRTFKLPKWDSFNAIVPYERDDDNKPAPRKAKKKKTKKQIAAEIEEFGRELSEEEEEVKALVPEAEIGMGGKDNRVYWPPGMEEWLRPKKREVKKKGDTAAEGSTAGSRDAEEEEALKHPTPANLKLRMEIKERNRAPLSGNIKGRLEAAKTFGEVNAIMNELKATREAASTKLENGDSPAVERSGKKAKASTTSKKNVSAKKNGTPAKSRKKSSAVKLEEEEDEDETDDLALDAEEEEEEEEDDEDLSMLESDDEPDDHATTTMRKRPAMPPARQSSRKVARKSYAEEDMDADGDATMR